MDDILTFCVIILSSHIFYPESTQKEKRNLNKMNMMDEYLDVMNRAIPADTNPAIVETVRGID